MGSIGHTARLALYLMAVVAVTLVHEPRLLLVALAGILLLSGDGRLALVASAARAVFGVLLLISSGYLLMGWWTAQPVAMSLVLINLRVLVLALLTTWMVRDVDLGRALVPWPRAGRWLVIVRAQVQLFRRLAHDHRCAQRSRAVVPPSLRQRYLGSAAIGLAALDKGVHNAEMVTLAMRSRGALDD